MGILQSFGPNYPEISGVQNTIFEHLKEDITLIRKEKTNHIYIGFLKTRGNNLKSLASIFQLAIRFHPGHLQPKTLAYSFSVVISQ